MKHQFYHFLQQQLGQNRFNSDFFFFFFLKQKEI